MSCHECSNPSICTEAAIIKIINTGLTDVAAKLIFFIFLLLLKDSIQDRILVFT